MLSKEQNRYYYLRRRIKRIDPNHEILKLSEKFIEEYEKVYFLLSRNLKVNSMNINNDFDFDLSVKWNEIFEPYSPEYQLIKRYRKKGITRNTFLNSNLFDKDDIRIKFMSDNRFYALLFIVILHDRAEKSGYYMKLLQKEKEKIKELLFERDITPTDIFKEFWNG